MSEQNHQSQQPSVVVDPESHAQGVIKPVEGNPASGGGPAVVPSQDGQAQPQPNNNENSAMSFWSSSNSDSDDFGAEGHAGKASDAADQQTTRRGRKGQGSRSRRRRSPGSDNGKDTAAAAMAGDERKEYEGRRGRRSRSRDNSAEANNRAGAFDGQYQNEALGGINSGFMAGAPDEQAIGGHHRGRTSPHGGSRHSSQERDGGRYDGGRRRGGGMYSGGSRRDIGSMGGGPSGYNPRGRGDSNYRGRGRGGRDGGNQDNNKGYWPQMSKPLASFQQFSSMQSRGDLYQLKGQYKAYVNEHREKHAKAFWKEHEDEPWFMEQYNPMTCFQIKSEQRELTQAKAQAFFEKMPFAELDLTKRDDGSVSDGPQIHKFDPNDRTLYLKQVPVYVARVQLKEAVTSVTNGLEQIIFSKPLQFHNYERFAWLVYQTAEMAEAAIADLETLVIRAPQDSQAENFKLSPVKNSQTVKPPKVTPQMALDHIPRDIDLCKRLIKEVFDAEKQIEFPFDKLEAEVQVPEAILDTLLLYLRQVHAYCFYCGKRCEDERQLAGKCASQHLRLPPSVDRVILESSALYGSALQFEQNYVKAAEKLLEAGPEEKPVDPQEDELLVELKNQYCQDKTREVVEGKKYVCEICDKAFRTIDFVVKHIKNKHDEKLVRFNYPHFRELAREAFVTELHKSQDNTAQQAQMPFTGRDQSNKGDQQPFNQFSERGHRGGRGDFRDRGGYGRGGRGGYHNQGSFNRGNQGDHSMMGGPGNEMPMDENDGDKMRRMDSAGKPQAREYIDYDDPTQFDGQGQRIAGANAAAQTQLQQQQAQAQYQQQQMLFKQGAAARGGDQGSSSGGADRTLVSYDDLF